MTDKDKPANMAEEHSKKEEAARKAAPSDDFAKFDHDKDGRPGGSLPRGARQPESGPTATKSREEIVTGRSPADTSDLPSSNTRTPPVDTERVEAAADADTERNQRELGLPTGEEQLAAKRTSELPERQLTDDHNTERDNKPTREFERQHRRSAPGSMRARRPIL